MARYSSYRRGRYYRRGYRRGYRRYGGTSLRRYRSIQMNDNETRVMTFTSVCRVTMTPGVISTTYGTNLASMIRLDPINLMGPIFEVAPAASNPDTTPPTTVKSSYVTPVNGRIFFAEIQVRRGEPEPPEVHITCLELGSVKMSYGARVPAESDWG